MPSYGQKRIDLSDIPELTDEQLKEFRRVTPQEHFRFHQSPKSCAVCGRGYVVEKDGKNQPK